MPRTDLYTEKCLTNFDTSNPACLFYIGGIAGGEGPLATLVKDNDGDLGFIITQDSSSFLKEEILTIVGFTNLETIKESLKKDLVYLPLFEDKHYYSQIKRNFHPYRKTELKQDYISWDEIVKQKLLYPDLTYTDMFNWALDDYNLKSEKGLNSLFEELDKWYNSDFNKTEQI